MDQLKNCETSGSSRLFFRMLGFLRPVWPTALIAGLVVVARTMAEVWAVYFLSPAISMVVQQVQSSEGSITFWSWLTGSSTSAIDLRTTILWMILSQMILGAMIYLRSVWETRLSMRVVYCLRGKVFDHFQRAPLWLYDRLSTGQMMNRALSDLQSVRNFVNLSLLATLDTVASLVFYLGLLAYRSPLLMVAALLPVPFWSLIIYRFSQKARRLSSVQQKANDELMGVLSENLEGAQVVRAFGTQEREIQKFQTRNLRLYRRMSLGARLQAFFTPTLKLTGVFSHILLFLLSAWLLRRNDIHIGDLMLLGAVMAVILAKLQLINQVVEAFQKALVSSKRIYEVLDLKPFVTEHAKRPRLEFSEGQIEFQKVTVRDGNRVILDGVDLKLQARKVTALVGPTGAGKTTLASLLARFQDPQEGQISIDGQNIKEVDLKELRRAVGYVFQETFLFSQSVRDNIRYGRSDVSEHMLRRAAVIADADDFIGQLPQGYDTLIGEKGVQLSGGQRQRLALARALVYDPPILVLDDATAALDVQTEQLIHDRLDPVLKGRTVLIIAHRATSVKSADQVHVLEAGRLIQSGTHSDLLTMNQHYRQIFSIQRETEWNSDETSTADL